MMGILGGANKNSHPQGEYNHTCQMQNFDNKCATGMKQSTGGFKEWKMPGPHFGSTEVQQAAATDIKGGIGGAGGSMGSMAAVEPQINLFFLKENKKGMWEASRDLYWPTFHSYWHDKDKNPHLHFFCCPSLWLSY